VDPTSLASCGGAVEKSSPNVVRSTRKAPPYVPVRVDSIPTN